MKNISPAPRVQPTTLLKAGQVWHMVGANLQVGMVGKLLVHYKLGKPDAIRTPNSCSGVKTIEKYLKKHKATLAPA